jgi:hypothetical protein
MAGALGTDCNSSANELAFIARSTSVGVTPACAAAIGAIEPIAANTPTIVLSILSSFAEMETDQPSQPKAGRSKYSNIVAGSTNARHFRTTRFRQRLNGSKVHCWPASISLGRPAAYPSAVGSSRTTRRVCCHTSITRTHGIMGRLDNVFGVKKRPHDFPRGLKWAESSSASASRSRSQSVAPRRVAILQGQIHDLILPQRLSEASKHIL